MDVNKVAFLVNEEANCWQALRCLFGCLVGNIWCGAFIMDCAVHPPSEMEDREFREHLESFVVDMEAEIFSNVRENAERYEHIRYLTIEEMVPKIRTYQLVVPF